MCAERIVKEEQGQERILRFGVWLSESEASQEEEALFLVVVQGLGQEPLMLLTNLEIRKSRSSLWRVIESYLTRWRVEETTRFLNRATDSTIFGSRLIFDFRT
jgi:hypothetical protein